MARAIPGDVELHVRLAGAEPDFANQNVFDHDWGFTGLLPAMVISNGPPALSLVEAYHPFAVGVGGCRTGLAIELDGDPLGGIGCAPDGTAHAAL